MSFLPIKYKLVLILSILSIATKAQNSYNKEILLTNENDFYLLNGQDSYYTNGFFAQFSIAKQKKEQKIINQFSIAQTMFTTHNRRYVWSGLEPLDRPYCGYLSIKYTRNRFLSSNQLFAYAVDFGGTGDYALAQKLYSWYHKKLGLFEYPYWDFQIPTSIGINVSIKYAKSYTTQNKHWQITPTYEATLGNYFINTKAGVYLTTGSFKTINNSVLFNSLISTKNNQSNSKKQFIYYLYPQIILQGYNATIQGEMNKTYDSTVFTTKPQPIIFQSTLGAAYAKNRITAKLEYVFQTREVINQITNHRWVGFHFGYRF